MAFVTCGKFQQSQEEQDKALEALKNGAISADESLLDKSNGDSAGKITVEKIKKAIAGDVAVAVKSNAGISGNGTKDSPLALNLGDSLSVGEDGKIDVSADNLKQALGTVRLVDASGNLVLGNILGA